MGWALACVVASALALACAPGASAAPLTLSVKDAKAAEGKNAVLVVRLSRAPTATVRVRFLTANGTARKGTDYLAKTGTLVFKRGQRVKRVTVKTVLETEPLGIFPVAGTKRTALAIFTITLSRASPQTITFDYAAVDNTATAGLDFNPAGGPVTFSPGVVTSQLGITVTSDGSNDLPEPNETYFVQLSNFVNVTPLKPQGIGTIVD